jgi:ABC-type transporter Mla subunit MlaD
VKKVQLNEVVVGLTFLVGLVLLGSYTILISDLTLGGTHLYLVDFSDVFGLKRGDVVRVDGFEKGKVKELNLLTNGDVRALLEVSSDVEIYRDGSEVRVTPFSPLGGRVVEISRGRAGEAGDGGPRGAYEPYTEDMSDEQAEKVVISGKAEGELLQTLNKLVEENSEPINEIVQNLKHVSVQLTQTDNVLGYLVNEPLARDKVEGILTHMDSASGHIDSILARVDQGEGVVGQLTVAGTPLERDLEGAVNAGRGALESADRILDRADRGDSGLGVFVGEDKRDAANVRGIVSDVKHISGEISDPEGDGTLSKLVHDGRLYEGTADTFQNLGSITGKIDQGHGLLGVLVEEESGDHARRSLKNIAEITDAVNDPEAGAVGLLIHDDALRGRVNRIVEDVERLVVEFRDSLEDVREQAPVNAFIGAIFAAF